MASKEDRKLAAIMFTDIVGYSSMMSADESTAVKSLREKESILNPLITNHNGNLVKNIGDGTLSYYNSAIDAVRCGIELQKSFQKDKGLRIRVGIHLGDIVLENNDIYGEGVNVASRLESMALEGSVLISKDVYDQLSNHAEFDAVSLGLQSLKGVGRLIEIYGVKNKHIVTPDPSRYKNNLVQHHKVDSGVPSVAIIPFENKGAEEDIFYSFGISSGLIKKCSQAGMIRVESLKDIEKIDNHYSLSAKELGQKLSVQYIVTGTLWKVNNIFQLSIEVYNNEESKVVWSDHFEEDWNNLPQIKTKLADGVLKTLDKKTDSSNPTSTIDSIAYEYYLKASYRYYRRENSEDTEIVRSLYKKAIKLAPNLIDARIGLGVTYLETGDYGRAKNIYREAIEKSESINDLRGKANSFDGLGNIHWHKGNYDKSLENLYISLDILKKLNDQSAISRSLSQIGHNYYYKGEYDKAHDYYSRSIDIVKEMDDRQYMGNGLLNLGNIYEAKKDISRSLECYEEAYEIFKRFNNKYAVGYAQMGIGNMHKKLRDYDKAIEYYKASLTTRIEIDDKSGIAMLNHNIAVIYKEIYDYPSALELFSKALEMTEQLGDRYSSAVVLKNIGEIYRIKGKYSEAIKAHEKSLEIRQELEQYDYIAESFNVLTLTSYLSNDLDKASNYVMKASQIKFQDDVQLALRDLYRILVSGKEEDSEVLKKIIENVKNNQTLTYETYYFLYKVSNEPKYLELAKQSIKDIQKNHIKSSALSDYPIPALLLNLKV